MVFGFSSVCVARDKCQCSCDTSRVVPPMCVCLIFYFITDTKRCVVRKPVFPSTALRRYWPECACVVLGATYLSQVTTK